MTDGPYGIGQPGTPWGDSEKREWLARQRLRRSYAEEVLKPVAALSDRFAISDYGILAYEQGTYAVQSVCSAEWRDDLPTVVITGGVHGYETSGVQGAIRFLQTAAERYASQFNFAVAPCVSPWGYETINRWNPLAIDPNRSFCEGSGCDESALLMAWVARLPGPVIAHFDLHETTDTDNSEFRPALAARDGVELEHWDIPDGFYLVGDSEAPAPDFQRAIIEAVSRVTPIAPADDTGRIIGVPVEQAGVINYDVNRLFLCASVTSAPFRTTTEVYPDSPRVDDENCIEAQVAAIRGGLDYLLARESMV